MVVVDTSAWIEWLRNGPLTPELAQRIPGRAACVVPTIVQLELTKWLRRERGEEAADDMLAYTRKCVVADLDSALAVQAAEACRVHRLATADAIVFATAERHGAALLTCDAHFDGLPDVVLVRKAQV